ncbi:MAG: cyanophycinase [Gammaproteobacteria bacterium]
MLVAVAATVQAKPQAPVHEQPQPRGQTTPAPVVAKPPEPVVDINKPKTPPKGSLVIIGGGLRGENAPVWQRIVALAGGPGARIAVFGTASNAPERAALADVEQLNAYGADAFVVPVQGRVSNDPRAPANDPEVAKAVASAGGAYFVGGDQARITAALRRQDGTNTAVLDALWSLYRRGGVIAGTSAGAAMMSSTMFYQVRSVLSTLKRGVADGMELSHGLGFIGDEIFVDQHLLVRGRFARMLPAMLAKNYKYGLGIDENTAMIISPDRDVEIIGYKGALLLDLTEATSEAAGAFNVSNVKISYLDNGDHYSFATRKATPSPDKAGGKFDPKNPYYRGPLFSADILGHTAVADLMTKLVDSDQSEAIGIAFGSPRDLQPDLGFEFRFSRTKDTVGYASAIYDAYSAYYMRLDVRPITIKQPFYEYRTPNVPVVETPPPAPPVPLHKTGKRK